MRILPLLFTPFLFAYACGGSLDVVPDDAGAGSDGGVDISPRDAGRDRQASSDGSAKDVVTDQDNGRPSETYPAFKPGVPQGVSAGGPVMASPKVVAITFPNDPFVTQIEDFTNKIGNTGYWKAIAEEYGVGKITPLTPIRLTESAPTTIDDDQVKTWLASKLDGTHPEFPAPDDNTIYALYYPANTTITLGGSRSCLEFGGYHYEGRTAAGKRFAYAVQPRCQNFGQLTGMDVLSLVASHEYLEAATDPFPDTNGAYQNVDNDNVAWSFVFLPELADLCVWPEELDVTPPDLGYLVQRSWSNKSAKGWHHPCAPVPQGEVYFNSAPALPDRATISGFNGAVSTKTVKVPVGSTRTIDLQLFSDAPTGGPWNVRVVDAAQIFGGSQSLDLSLDRASGQNGEKLHLTIRTTRRDQMGFSIFMVVSELGGQRTYWPAIVSY